MFHMIINSSFCFQSEPVDNTAWIMKQVPLKLKYSKCELLSLSIQHSLFFSSYGICETLCQF